MLLFDLAHPCGNVTAPASQLFITGGLSALLCLVTVPGNLLVVLAVFIDPNKELRSPFSYLVANLAMADLLAGLVTEPFSANYHISRALGLTRGDDYALHMTFFISCLASILSLAALTLDRFVAIAQPVRYRVRGMDWVRTIIVCSVVWGVSLSLPFVYLFVGYVRYTFLFANSAVVLTFLVLLFVYLRIYRIFRSQVREWESFHDSTAESYRRKRAARWEQKVTKTLLIMLALFIGCYLPACFFIYVMNLCHVCDCTLVLWARDLQFLLILLNSCMNPFVYGWRLCTFRRAFVWIVTCSLRGRKPRNRAFQLSMKSFRRTGSRRCESP